MVEMPVPKSGYGPKEKPGRNPFPCSWHIEVRVMRTCGMMGEVVGKAAAICVRHNTTPRGVYENHLDELLNKTPSKD
jgi:hypothetical protein